MCKEHAKVVFLDESGEEPEGEFFVVDDVEDLSRDKAHSLAIANVWVDMSNTSQDVLNLRLHLGLSWPLCGISPAHITTGQIHRYLRIVTRVCRLSGFLLSSCNSRAYALSKMSGRASPRRHRVSILKIASVAVLYIRRLGNPKEVACMWLQVSQSNDSS